MDKIEDELTEEDKKFLDKMFGDQEFLKNPDKRKHPPITDKETFGDALGSFFLKGPTGVDNENYDIFHYAWEFEGDDIEFVWLDGFTYLLLEEAIFGAGRGPTGLEGKLCVLLRDIEFRIHSARPSMDQYSFAQFLTLLNRKAIDWVNEDGMVCKRLISIREDGLKFMIRCAEYVKGLLEVFKFDTDKVLTQYLTEAEWRTKAECYKRYYQDRDKQKIIAADLGISQSSVANYIDEVQGRLSFEMGQAYEDYFEKNVAPRKYDRYVRMGGKGEPDGIGYKGDNIEVLNLKCHNATRGSSDTIHRSGLRAEIEYARKLIQEDNKNVRVKLIYHELSRNLDFERDVDIGDEGQKITINFEAPTPSV